MNSLTQPKQVDIEHLPESGSTLFGREDDLKFLNKMWNDKDARIVSLVAQGGVGKTALIRRWLTEMGAEGYRGAKHVKAWSFYSQGIGDRIVSAEVFVDHALREWFHDKYIADGTLSSWEKGRCLAEHLQKERTLLILDGLEPLQSPLASERGKVKDLAIASLLKQLAEKNPGLCVITTREPVKDLVKYTTHAIHRDLEQISAQTGREILRHHGVKGKDMDLVSLSQEFCNHALTITLLAAYLAGTPGKRVENVGKITTFVMGGKIDKTEGHARQVSYI